MTTNKFKAECDACGLIVHAGTGHCQRDGNRWSVTHADCQSPYVEHGGIDREQMEQENAMFPWLADDSMAEQNYR
jgi:hypothetical protein